MIVHEEIARVGYPGFTDGLGTGLVIGLPPIMHFAKPDVQAKVITIFFNGYDDKFQSSISVRSLWLGYPCMSQWRKEDMFSHLRTICWKRCRFNQMHSNQNS